VERRQDPKDARAVLVHLTPQGLERLDAMRAAREALLQARLSTLTDDEREVLAAALPVLDKLMEEGTGE
jgi:DNA-binding MarR family transcriptional regulator